MGNVKVSFIYVRQTPTVQLMEKLVKELESSNLIMGDFNLDPCREADKSKLKQIEDQGYRRVLNEVTTTRINQLDHIFMKSHSDEFFSTCYNNHTSDHKVLAIRLPIGTNKITEEFKREYYYHRGKQSHQSENENKLVTETSSKSQDKGQPTAIPSRPSKKRKEIMPTVAPKRTRVEFRCIRNPDNESCWLNSCLQFMLAALDHSLVQTLPSSTTLVL